MGPFGKFPLFEMHTNSSFPVRSGPFRYLQTPTSDILKLILTIPRSDILCFCYRLSPVHVFCWVINRDVGLLGSVQVRSGISTLKHRTSSIQFLFILMIGISEFFFFFFVSNENLVCFRFSLCYKSLLIHFFLVRSGISTPQHWTFLLQFFIQMNYISDISISIWSVSYFSFVIKVHIFVFPGPFRSVPVFSVIKHRMLSLHFLFIVMVNISDI